MKSEPRFGNPTYVICLVLVFGGSVPFRFFVCFLFVLNLILIVTRPFKLLWVQATLSGLKSIKPSYPVDVFFFVLPKMNACILSVTQDESARFTTYQFIWSKAVVISSLFRCDNSLRFGLLLSQIEQQKRRSVRARTRTATAVNTKTFSVTQHKQL